MHQDKQRTLGDITQMYFSAFKEGIAPALQPEFSSRKQNAASGYQAHTVPCNEKNFVID